VTTALDVTLACDTMMDVEGSIRPAMYLASELVTRGYRVSMMSPAMSNDVEELLRASGIAPINLRAKLVTKNLSLSLLWLETWAREAFFKLNSKWGNKHSNVIVNFSHTLVVPSMFWYLQGPTSVALRDMEDELTLAYRLAYRVLKPLIELADVKLVKNMGRESTFVVANSKFCASMYQKWGIEVSDIIYPPIDCKVFQPRTSSPCSDYVLAYFGKESKFSVIKAVADLGVSIKAFGSKAPFVPRSVITHPNIEFLGRISTDELVDVYSNALFTLFPFTHEPFGYIPVESMACGTPTLTYNSQGPGESIIDGCTGWLAESDEALVRRALEFWNKGCPPEVRQNCIKAVSKFDKKFYTRKWLDTLQKYF